jgi:acetyltransferase-like isoleucine patch superfamily enzyme
MIEKNTSTFPSQAMSTAHHLQQFRRDYLTIDCGDWTYGNPRIELAPDDHPRKLTIGRYCSIAANVTIYVGRQGRHPTDTLSTYPLSLPVGSEALRAGPAKLPGFSKTAALGENKLDVTIGHDVWIGQNAIIFAGVTVGNGAIIGASALVTKDVPAYAIVGGIPAEVMRHRHPPDLAERIAASDWWTLHPDELWRRIGENAWSTDVLQVLTLIEKGNKHLTEEARFKYWPTAEVQQKYTGASGDQLYTRTRRFVDFLANEGALPAPDLSVLDYACGWGRIASVIYETHRIRCVLADAWVESHDILRSTGLPGELLQVPTMLTSDSLGNRLFSLIYAFSIFTHLSPDAFRNNLLVAIAALAPKGRMYLTVRHDDFLGVYNLKSKSEAVQAVAPDGVHHYTYSGGIYGETIIGRKYFETLGIHARYCCEIDPMQHLYCITR